MPAAIKRRDKTKRRLLASAQPKRRKPETIKPLYRTKQAKKRRYGHLYASALWAKLRWQVISKHPFCRHCGAPSSDVDHIQPHYGRERLFYDSRNLQALCRDCHKTKTAQERARRSNLKPVAK